ncbi:uncharacterized protein VTP21DRAFT_7040 [Calcarisporiella thermophila]|uniref:uncharacterized protein n=1 Tax=Calcarisporiella thermophila TaxID=911321 RepID=UPI0037421CB8
MSTQIHQQFLSLYRSYLRVLARWPKDPLRPTRDPRKVLAARVQEAFHRGPNSREQDLNLEEALAKGKSELKALEKLLTNEYKNRYQLSDKILNPASNPNYYTRLLAGIDASKLKQQQQGGLISSFIRKVIGRPAAEK